MKISAPVRGIFVPGIFWFGLNVVLSAAEPSRQVVDIVTADELAKQRKTAPQYEQGKEFQPSENTEDPSKKNVVSDIVSQSDILSYAGYTTLVPKHAIVHRPAGFEDRYVFKPGTKVVNWPAFYQANRGWITVIEITRAQAEGNVPLAEEVQEMLRKSTSLVVAVYQGDPISLLPKPVVSSENNVPENPKP